MRVHTRHYGAKVGKDIDLIMLGRVDFTDLTDHIAEAFVYKVQELCYAAVYGAAAKLPVASQFKKTGSITKQVFDQLIEDVEVANRTSVVIMGTKTALKTLNGFTDVNWRAESQKESVAQTGRLGMYEGTRLVEIPQRFALNDVTKKLFDDTMLLVIPMGQEKFVKFTDVGETEIIERGQEKADLFDDFRTYEVQREFGVAAQLGNYIGMVSAQ